MTERPPEGIARRLEQEWVQVGDELRLLWHRPPLQQVEEQLRDPGTVRIFVNGCFDLMHVGHYNALRQAKSVFYQKGFQRVVLVAGLHSDAAIAGQKGPPLLTEEERIAVLRATKWVDELATALPYVSMSVKMADALRVHWVCHGDDLPICKAGGGMYSDVIEHNRFQLVKRTEGISTTQILERLLRYCGGSKCVAGGPLLETALATMHRLSQFAAPADPCRAARPISAASRVVYVGGTFDLLHAGHVELLERAASLGDYLLVGLHSDEAVRHHKGATPVLTLLERAMAALSLHCVDDVVLGAPWEVTRDLITTMNISQVVAAKKEGEPGPRFAVARSMGVLAEVEVTAGLTTQAIIGRCAERREQLAERNGALAPKEASYTQGKRYVPEA